MILIVTGWCGGGGGGGGHYISRYKITHRSDTSQCPAPRLQYVL